MANLNRHVWEGWTPQDFIDELEPQLNIMQQGNNRWGDFRGLKTKAELKAWCKDNQPYYKKHVPEVVNYFAKKYELK